MLLTTWIYQVSGRVISFRDVGSVKVNFVLRNRLENSPVLQSRTRED